MKRKDFDEVEEYKRNKEVSNNGRSKKSGYSEEELNKKKNLAKIAIIIVLVISVLKLGFFVYASVFAKDGYFDRKNRAELIEQVDTPEGRLNQKLLLEQKLDYYKIKDSAGVMQKTYDNVIGNTFLEGDNKNTLLTYTVNNNEEIELVYPKNEVRGTININGKSDVFFFDTSYRGDGDLPSKVDLTYYKSKKKELENKNVIKIGFEY
ncbi:MAG: hypothetical protein RR543_01410 [Erysipelotrichales bacterium]